MIHIVSGYRRSGTSMMMQALYKGLFHGEVLYQPDLEKLNPDADGYAPNQGPLMEVGRAYYMNAAFLREIPDDSLVKILYDGLPCLPARDYRVVFMERDESEIKASLARSDAHLRANKVAENMDYGHTFDVFRPYRQEDIDHVLGIVRCRTDIDLTRMKFSEVIARPEAMFESLSDMGWPIDPKKAASVVNPELYRFRKEN